MGGANLCSDLKPMWSQPKVVARGVVLAGVLMTASGALAQSYMCEDRMKLDDAMASSWSTPEPQPAPVPSPLPLPKSDPIEMRLQKYVTVATKHRLAGLASHYSTSLDGTLTANGEIYRNRRMSAAHLTLPLGSWVQIRSRATGRRIRVRVNDRGPYSKFTIDLSQAAARALGVDVAEDRWVEIRLIALPGEEPLPQDVIDGPAGTVSEETQVSVER
jgi:rare lipoprotein A